MKKAFLLITITGSLCSPGALAMNPEKYTFKDLITAIKNRDYTTYVKIIHNPENYAPNIDFDGKDKQGRTALHHAVLEPNLYVVHMLLTERKVMQDIKDNSGKKPLDYANDKDMQFQYKHFKDMPENKLIEAAQLLAKSNDFGKIPLPGMDENEKKEFFQNMQGDDKKEARKEFLIERYLGYKDIETITNLLDKAKTSTKK